jgi:non-specific serine/threonine protein kinase
VDLSDVADSALVLPEVAAAIGSPADVVEYLAGRQLLLVLDNLEQIPAAPAVLGEVLTRCPGVAVLATSREPLRLRAELEYPLEPLAPQDGSALFLRQVRALAPRFDAPDDVLLDLSQQLDGLPLAIELAAARCRLLTARQLRARLDRRLPLLVGGARDAPPRHRTIEATIAWSHELLEPAEQRLFASLAAFVGEWELEAAEEVCGCLLDDLQALVDKSLVQASDGRFRMLETIREFAGQRLAELPDADRLRERHATYYGELVGRLEAELVGTHQEQVLEELGRAYGNVRAAMDWCASAGRASEAAGVSAGLVLFWFLRGMYGEATARLEYAEKVTKLDAADRGRVLWGLGTFATLTGRPHEAVTHLAEAETVARETNDRVLLARIMVVQGLLAFFANDMPQCRRTFEQGIELARAVGDTWSLTDGLGTLGSIYPLMGELQAAQTAASEGLSIARPARDLQGTRMALFALALVAVRKGDLRSAAEASEEGLQICRGLGDVWFVSYFEWILSTASRLAGDLAAAQAWAADALRVARQLDAPLLIVCALEASAASARSAGRLNDAAAQLREAESLGRAGGVPASYVSEVLRASAELSADMRDVTRARELATEAAEFARAVGDAWAERRAADLLASFAGS